MSLLPEFFSYRNLHDGNKVGFPTAQGAAGDTHAGVNALDPTFDLCCLRSIACQSILFNIWTPTIYCESWCKMEARRRPFLARWSRKNWPTTLTPTSVQLAWRCRSCARWVVLLSANFWLSCFQKNFKQWILEKIRNKYFCNVLFLKETTQTIYRNLKYVFCVIVKTLH